MSDPSIESCKPPFKCAFPIKMSEITLWDTPSKCHVDKLLHSVDFECDEGTHVYAARSGEVVWVKDDSNVGGKHRKFYNCGNRIVIRHQDGYYTAYEHLQYKGSKVVVGQKVRKGQLIGLSGNTGITSGPHLHFELFIKPSDDQSEGTTIPIDWDWHHKNAGFGVGEE